MAVDAWPAELPQYFEKEGYSEDLGMNVVTSDPETGPPLMRRRATAVPTMVSGAIICNATQYALFRTFFATHQALRFSWVDVRGAARYYMFADKPGITMVNFETYRVQLTLLEFTTEYGGV